MEQVRTNESFRSDYYSDAIELEQSMNYALETDANIEELEEICESEKDKDKDIDIIL